MLNLERSKKTTIIFLSWRDILAPKKGGAEIYTHEMLKRINHDKYRIIHISPMYKTKDGSESKTDEIIDNIRYIRHGNSVSVISYAKKFYKLNKEKIDYVVDQCNTHRFFSKFWVEASKRIFFIHQLTREIWFKNAKFPINLVGYLSEIPFLKLSKNDYTMTVSDSTRDDLINIGFDSNKVKIIPEGINFEPWNKKDFYPKEKEYTYIYVGRYSNYKGIDKVVEAFSKLKNEHKNIKLWIVGKKNENYIDTVLMPIIQKYRVFEKDVTFWGFVSEEKKLELMSRAHSLIFPSLREGWGLIITEAGAVGTPSIGYDSPGIRDALDKGRSGFLCKNNSIDGILEQMKEVINNTEEYKKMIEKAYEYSKKFHWKYTAKAFENFIEEISKMNKEV